MMASRPRVVLKRRSDGLQDFVVAVGRPFVGEPEATFVGDGGDAGHATQPTEDALLRFNVDAVGQPQRGPRRTVQQRSQHLAVSEDASDIAMHDCGLLQIWRHTKQQTTLAGDQHIAILDQGAEIGGEHGDRADSCRRACQ